MRWIWALAAAFIAGPAAAACNGAEGACTISSGEYHIDLPAGDGPFPALVFLHGAGGKGESMVRMMGQALDRGYAVIGPQGLKRPDSRFSSSWSFFPGREKIRDEAAFLREVIADASAKHRVDPDRILLGGFSIGGSMTTYLACEHPDLAKGFAPVAGGFWRPHPELDACAGPVDLFHTHGWTDGTVPLEGRPLRPGLTQGDIFYTMQVWRETNGCNRLRADRFEMDENWWRRAWDSCDRGSLELVLFPGGHGVPKGWANIALDWFEALPPSPTQ
ncbi:CE1 family esterase [Ovoidimarina sediminis]|uniref:alpha/beta hydrolase family esterase n=1 Tax=Ovoidimarina sediminis TaxID=3079856 RepID=UPI00290A0DD0|nr:alpha/beta fold hydrolase [Rhodophyticola sp. MJ-SS7]MDU8943768.1 alpha/beta fold hydrolase [Rhodophyticola sp. MJ-SS7]